MTSSTIEKFNAKVKDEKPSFKMTIFSTEHWEDVRVDTWKIDGDPTAATVAPLSVELNLTGRTESLLLQGESALRTILEISVNGVFDFEMEFRNFLAARTPLVPLPYSSKLYFLTNIESEVITKI
jgi:hypothetical protein